MDQPKFRKSNQYYTDFYDRETIFIMKEREKEWKEKNKSIADDKIAFKQQLQAHISLSELGILRARNKRTTVEQQQSADDQKEQLVDRTPIPPAPFCNICHQPKQFSAYDFIDNAEVQFIFSCPGNKRHNTILNAAGNRITLPKRFCPYCNATLKTKTDKKKNLLTMIDNCTVCTWSETTTFELKTQKQQRIQPIKDQDRKVYCEAYRNSRGIIEELKTLAELFKEEEVKIDISKVNLINIPELEKMLNETLTTQQFTQLKLGEPKMKDHILINFSILGTSTRNAAESIKTIQQIIKQALFPTNWRLIESKTEYRLGHISGTLKGADRSDDLIKIAEEISKAAHKL